MKISIIVPVYNVEEYLRDCIESVIQQTHDDFELILVDDGSKDSSRTICDQYAEDYPKHIKTIHTENGGPLKARLIGLQHITGQVAAFLDGDDYLCLDALEHIAKCFDENECDMVLYNTVQQNSHNSTINCPRLFNEDKIFTDETKSELYDKIIRGAIPNNIVLKAVRAECSDFPEHFLQLDARHGEDLLLSVCFMNNCEKIVYLDKELYYYRNRSGSAIHSFNFKRKESVKTVHIELEKYIEKWGIPELKSVHNARKVNGWIYNLKLLTDSRKNIDSNKFKCELISMSEDNYFRKAYPGIDKSLISFYDKLLAWCLYNKQYFLINTLSFIKEIVKK